MTDHDQLDELASAYLDGDVDDAERALVEDDPDLLARVRRLAQAREALLAGPALRAEAIERAHQAALAAADDAASVVDLDSRRPKTWLLTAAAAASVLIALVAVLAYTASSPREQVASRGVEGSTGDAQTDGPASARSGSEDPDDTRSDAGAEQPAGADAQEFSSDGRRSSETGAGEAGTGEAGAGEAGTGEAGTGEAAPTTTTVGASAAPSPRQEELLATAFAFAGQLGSFASIEELAEGFGARDRVGRASNLQYAGSGTQTIRLTGCPSLVGAITAELGPTVSAGVVEIAGRQALLLVGEADPSVLVVDPATCTEVGRLR